MSSTLQGSGRCEYHPERPGVGICVECRRVICLECTTQFEGINRCARCLDARLKKTTELKSRREWTFGNLLLSVLAVGTVFGGVYLVAALVAAR